MIYEVKGNLLESSCDYICHQVNCQKVMGAGLAKQIRNLWPQVYKDYCAAYDNAIWNKAPLLGTIISTPTETGTKIISMFAQESYGTGIFRYTSYDAFWQCLGEIRELVEPGETIAFPDGIGCGLGNANWAVIRTMIEQCLSDYDVYIYKL